MDKICGFCADFHSTEYRCANCGYRKTMSQITNFYEYKIPEWKDDVCPECGFKSFKPVDIGELLLTHHRGE